MDYFYVNPEDVSSHGLLLRGDESKHAVRVLRKTIGDRIFVTDGNDTMFEAVIAGIGAADARCEIAAMHRKFNEPAIDVTLAVSLLKNPSRFDFLVEKATELGVRTMIPLICERTISQHDKHQRLEKIALAAMKQCGRSWLPRIQPVQKFDTFIHNSSHWQWKLIPHEKVDRGQTIPSALKHATDLHSLLVVIGPEGGFSEAEIQNAKETGFLPVSFGLRRLRTETAAVLAAVQSQIG